MYMTCLSVANFCSLKLLLFHADFTALLALLYEPLCVFAFSPLHRALH
jgi:hypothetical protein